MKQMPGGVVRISCLAFLLQAAENQTVEIAMMAIASATPKQRKQLAQIVDRS
jgi:hypothetical protein